MSLQFSDFDFHDKDLNCIAYDFASKKITLFVDYYSTAITNESELVITFFGVKNYSSNFVGVFNDASNEIYSFTITNMGDSGFSCTIILLVGFAKPSYEIQFEFDTVAITRKTVS
jgi:hypothetical protein